MVTKTNTIKASSLSKTWETNRIRKLNKQIKLQPNNKNLPLALSNISYRRKKPNKREWSKSWKRMAQLFKLFSGVFDRGIMSSNKDEANAALFKTKINDIQIIKKTNITDKNYFALSARLHNNMYS